MENKQVVRNTWFRHGSWMLSPRLKTLTGADHVPVVATIKIKPERLRKINKFYEKVKNLRRGLQRKYGIDIL